MVTTTTEPQILAPEGAPSPSYSLALRIKLSNKPGTLGRLTTVIGQAGGNIEAIDIVEAGRDSITRDITVNAASDKHGEQIVEAVRNVDGIQVIQV